VADEDVQRLRALTQDWDGHGAPPVTRAALNVVAALHIVPRGNGGVQFEWHVNGQDVEISVGPSGRLDGFFIEEADRA